MILWISIDFYGFQRILWISMDFIRFHRISGACQELHLSVCLSLCLCLSSAQSGFLLCLRCDCSILRVVLVFLCVVVADIICFFLFLIDVVGPCVFSSCCTVCVGRVLDLSFVE